MKQLLFLLLFPAYAMAQYQGNAGQKITLGEQTTADGLVWRGRLADTANLLTNKLDTSVYIVLDTGTRAMWYYRASTTPKWTRLVDSLNNLQGTLSVAKGGTGSATQNFVDLTTTQSIGGAKTFTSEVTATRFNPTANTATGTGMFLPAANTLGFSTNGTNKMTLDASGNLGLGVTPSAWTSASGRKAIEIGALGNAMFGNGASDFYMLSNAFTDGTFKYANNGPAAYYRHADAEHRWGIAPSGTAGNAISFTQAMTLDALGRLGIGTESPTARLQVKGSGTTSSTTALKVDNNGNTNLLTVLDNGNVGIGTSSPLSKLNVMGTVRINSEAAPDANYYLQLENSSSQKAKAYAWDTYSDKRIKTDIQPIFNAIDKVNLLNPVYYQKHDSYVENDFLNIDFDSSVKSLGFIAQEVYNVIPEAVNTGTTNELWAMDYTKIIPILTKAIQEQQTLIKALEQRIINLENK